MNEFEYHNKAFLELVKQHKEKFGVEPDLETYPDPFKMPYEYAPEIKQAIDNGVPFVANEDDELPDDALL